MGPPSCMPSVVARNVVMRLMTIPPPPGRSDCRSKLIYANTTSRTVPTSDISLGSLKLIALEAGDFVELILPFPLNRN